MEDHYKVTATDWASSLPPADLAKSIAAIKSFVTYGTPEELLQMSDQLICKNNHPKLHDCGMNLLLNLVTKRWGDLSDEQKQLLFLGLPKLMGGAATASAWSTKNKLANLLSELIGKDGNWAKLVNASIAYFACDEIQAERAIVTCLSEGITIPKDEFRDKRSNTVKIQNWDSILEPLFSLLHKHLAKHNPSQVSATQQHYDFALFIANTASAYAKWVEVKNLVKGVGGMDFIESSTRLLGEADFFPAGFAYLSEICLRAKSTDCDHAVLMGIFQTVFELLQKLPLDSAYFGFRQTVCLSLVSVKQALGPDFDHLIKKNVLSSLKALKAAGSITDAEYHELRDKVCDDTDMIG